MKSVCVCVCCEGCESTKELKEREGREGETYVGGEGKDELIAVSGLMTRGGGWRRREVAWSGGRLVCESIASV